MKQKLVSWKFPFIIPAFLITLLIPWNNNDSNNSIPPVLNHPSSSYEYVDLKDFPVLRLSKAEMVNLFAKGNGPAVKKLVFKFNINDTEASNPSLTVFRAKKSGRRYIPGAPTTLARTTRTCEITGEYTLGNLELDNKAWATVLGKAGANTYLYFYPKKELMNGVYSVVYLLYWGNDAPPIQCLSLLPAAPPPPPDGGLNPSPPADPS